MGKCSSWSHRPQADNVDMHIDPSVPSCSQSYIELYPTEAGIVRSPRIAHLETRSLGANSRPPVLFHHGKAMDVSCERSPENRGLPSTGGTSRA